MEKELLSKSKIAEALGTNPMRVSRFIEREKITYVKKEGKRELYSLTDFNVLKEELNTLKAQSEAKKHSFSKDEYILTLKKQLEEQKKQFDEVLRSKDETISSLKEAVTISEKVYNDMKDQMAVKDEQISSLTKLTNNAQTLNLVDKDPERLKVAQSDAEINNGKTNSAEEEDNQLNKNFEESHGNWITRLFGKK